MQEFYRKVFGFKVVFCVLSHVYALDAWCAVANVANNVNLVWQNVLLEGASFDADGDMPSNSDLVMDAQGKALLGGSVSGEALIVDASDNTRYLAYRAAVDPSFSQYLIIVFDAALNGSLPDGATDFALVVDTGSSKEVYVTGSDGTGANTRPNNTDFYLAASNKNDFKITDALVRMVHVDATNDDYVEVFLNFSTLTTLLLQDGSGGGTQIVSSPVVGLDQSDKFRYALTSSANINNVNKDISGTSSNDYSILWNAYLSPLVSFENPVVRKCSVNNGGCDVHASCVEGMYEPECTCMAGYTGDGYACVESSSDPDTDDDGVLNADDNDPNDPHVCKDDDADGCDDCSSGVFATNNDGPDYDDNGICDVSDPEPSCAISNGGCSAHASCSVVGGSVLCVCNSGYSGDGVSCNDINECSNDTDGCDANASCANVSGGYTCTCNSGYSGDGVTCVDVNECLLGGDGCSEHASCVNTSGSYTCACDSGYAGDGVTCADVDECSLETDNCSVDASCTNTLGGYTCLCDSGYAGDGVTCVDVDECSLDEDDCSAHASCVNTSGSYTCACDSGYAGDGVTCADVDECSLETDNCSVDASCTNTLGGYTCLCDSGYAGDGVTCVDVDECSLDEDGCSVHASCTNTSGSYTCACNVGYAMHEGVCQNVDECQEGTDECFEGSLCRDTEGSYTCVCPYGYVLDEGQCVDVDECALEEDYCGEYASCVNVSGGYLCQCQAGYEGDGFSCVASAIPWVDTDGDGIPDHIEGEDDIDGDGLPNSRDLDSDGDGISDRDENTYKGTGSSSSMANNENDSSVKNSDSDYDNDGYSDQEEAGDDDVSTPPLNTDNDLIPDWRDEDSDNDGVLDKIEKALGTNPRLSDTDGDGLPDYLEGIQIGSDAVRPTHIEGSGCQSTQGSDMWMLLCGMVIYVLYGAKKQWMRISAFVWVCAVSVPSFAGVSAQRLRVVPQLNGFTSVVESDIDSSVKWGTLATVSYALNPVEFALVQERERAVGIVGHLTELNLGVYGHVGSWMQWGASMPVFMCGLGGTPKAVFAARILSKKGEVCGIGDASLFLKQRLFGYGSKVRWTLSFVEEVRADTSTRTTFFGRGAWELSGGLSSGWKYRNLRMVANLFYDWVIENKPVFNATDDDKIRWGLGVAYRISKAWEVQTEYTGAGGLFVKNIPWTKEFFDPTTTAHVLDASVLWNPSLSWWLKVGAGAGLSRGVGVPDMRVYLQTGYNASSL